MFICIRCYNNIKFYLEALDAMLWFEGFSGSEFWGFFVVYYLF